MGGDYFALCLALEELARVDSSVAITLEAGVWSGRDADLPVRHRGAEAAVAARPVRGRGPGRVRPDRTGRRLGRRGHPDHRPAGRRRLGDQRHQGVHHQLRHRHHRPGHGDRRDRGAGGRPEGDLGHHRAGRHARVHRVEEVLQGGLERLRHPRAVVRPTAGCPRPTCWASAAAATPSSCRPWTRAGSPSPRWPPGWPRAASTSACGTWASGRRSATRSGSTRPSSSSWPTWRPGPTPPGWPTTHAAAKLVAGEPFKKEAAIAKLVSSNAAMDNARDATQIFGGYGFMNESPVGPLLPGRQDPGDRRGHQRGPAHAHRPPAWTERLMCRDGFARWTSVGGSADPRQAAGAASAADCGRDR